MAVTMGGHDSEPHSRRPSYEGRGSLDAVRRSMHRPRKKLGSRQHSYSSETADSAAVQADLGAMSIPLPKTCYLLISPLLPPISTLATMFSSLRLDRTPGYDDKFVCHPTLAIYGGDDFFTSQRKLARWAENLKVASESHFQFREIAGAGHFWRDDESASQLRKCVKDWVRSTTVQRPAW